MSTAVDAVLEGSRAGVRSAQIPTSVTILRPSRGLVSLRLKELWEYRELAYFLVWRDIKVRYKQTVIGVAWAMIQPLAMMVVFTLFFGKFTKTPSEGVPYPLFAYVGLLPWQIFSRTISESADNLVALILFFSGLWFFRSRERAFADILGPGGR